MVAFNFKKDFAADIKSGKKRQTIRQTYRCDPGQQMQLYTGQRTKECQHLKTVECIQVLKIIITETGMSLAGSHQRYINGWFSKDQIARDDGFADWAAFKAFFKEQYGLPFTGYLYLWN